MLKLFPPCLRIFAYWKCTNFSTSLKSAHSAESFWRCWKMFLPKLTLVLCERIFHIWKWTIVSTSPPSARSAEMFWRCWFSCNVNVLSLFGNGWCSLTSPPTFIVYHFLSTTTPDVCFDKLQSPATRKFVCIKSIAWPRKKYVYYRCGRNSGTL